jgi:hypothetical protein
MPRITRILLACAIAFVGVPAIRGQAADSGGQTQAVRATLEARRVEVRGERYCFASDGLYRFAHEIYEGTSTGDEDLTGRFVLEIHAADNVTQGFQGLATGTVKVLDPVNGRLKLVARVYAVDSPSINPLGVKVDGFVNGQILSEGDGRGERSEGAAKVLFANFSVLLDPTAAFVGNLGGDLPVAPQNAAVAQSNAATCAATQ